MTGNERQMVESAIRQSIGALQEALKLVTSPCEKCGSQAGVDFYPIGGAGRNTPLCAPCYDKIVEETARWWAEYNAAHPKKAQQDVLRADRSFCHRLFGGS
jgi:hypothetical protein